MDWTNQITFSRALVIPASIFSPVVMSWLGLPLLALLLAIGLLLGEERPGGILKMDAIAEELAEPVIVADDKVMRWHALATRADSTRDHTLERGQ